MTFSDGTTVALLVRKYCRYTRIDSRGVQYVKHSDNVLRRNGV